MKNTRQYRLLSIHILCVPNLVSEKKRGVQTSDRHTQKGTVQLYIGDNSLIMQWNTQVEAKKKLVPYLSIMF